MGARRAWYFSGTRCIRCAGPDRIRSSHFATIYCPILFIQGTRDPLCDLNLLGTEIVDIKANAALHIIEGGDHSFKVTRSMQRAEQVIWQEIVAATLCFISMCAGNDR